MSNLKAIDQNNDPISPEQYVALIEEHGNLAGIAGFTEQDVNDRYYEALEAYNRGDYPLASQQFSLLTLLNPKDGELQLATGSALQQIGEHDRALEHFLAAAELLPADAGVWFRVAECQISISKLEEARDSLRECLNLCCTSSERPGLYEHAKALMDQLI
jgi:tetratricopeptide (TPR) repeat protein